MIKPEIISINLTLNSVGSINTGKYFWQFDNKVATLHFKVFTEDQEEIDYSEIQESYISFKFQDGTYSQREICEIDLENNKIIYELTCKELCKSGMITGALRLCGEGCQVFSSNIFRFTVLQDSFGDTNTSTEEYSELNELLTKMSDISFEEDKRVTQELDRINAEEDRVEAENSRRQSETLRAEAEEERKTNELLRKSSESTRNDTELSRIESEKERKLEESARISSELSRIANEENRVTSEKTRIINENTRQESIQDIQDSFLEINNDFETIKTDYNQIKTDLPYRLTQSITYEVPECSDSLSKPIYIVPDGVVMTIRGAKIICNGDAVGLDIIDENSVVMIKEGTDIVCENTFDLNNAFPNNNEPSELVMNSGLVDKDDMVYLVIENTDNVTTPQFRLQVDFYLEKL